MELERAMRHGVVPVTSSLEQVIRWHNMVHLIMAHYPLAKDGEPADDGQYQYQHDQHIFYGEQFGGIFQNGAFKPGRGCTLICHTFWS